MIRNIARFFRDADFSLHIKVFALKLLRIYIIFHGKDWDKIV